MSPWLRSKWWTYGNESLKKKVNAKVKFLCIQNKYSTPRGTLMEIRNSWFFWGFTPCVLWSNGIYTHIQIFFYDSKFYGSLTIIVNSLTPTLQRNACNITSNVIMSVIHQPSQSAITCSKLTIETVEQGLKYVQS